MLLNYFEYYRWTKIKGGEVSRQAVIMFPQGYQIQLLPRA